MVKYFCANEFLQIVILPELCTVMKAVGLESQAVSGAVGCIGRIITMYLRKKMEDKK